MSSTTQSVTPRESGGQLFFGAMGASDQPSSQAGSPPAGAPAGSGGVLSGTAGSGEGSSLAPDAATGYGGDFSWGGYFTSIGLLLGVLILFLVGLRALRRMGKARFLPPEGGVTRQDLYLEGQLPLGPDRGVYVVRCLDQRLVLGVTSQEINVLTTSYVDMGDDGDRDGEEDSQGFPSAIQGANRGSR